MASRPAEASSHVGENTSVCGLVAGVHQVRRSRGKPTLILHGYKVLSRKPLVGCSSDNTKYPQEWVFLGPEPNMLFDAFFGSPLAAKNRNVFGVAIELRRLQERSRSHIEATFRLEHSRAWKPRLAVPKRSQLPYLPFRSKK